VLLLTIRHGEDHLLYCSDVQGPISESALKYILKVRPKVLVVSGPPLYLEDYKVDSEVIKVGLKNLSIIAKRIPYTLVDHHILRSEEGLKEIAKLDRNRVKTFAEHLGLKNNLLEANRAKLYEENPPDREFQRWLRLPPSQQKVQLPPI
ncbi:MAG: hypothetical protein N3F06_04350, partial [Nitrososphaerales archaeon]|nr:hypothetical protein [Nitrososphaerales archaeon]